MPRGYMATTFVVKARETPLVLRDQQWLEGALAVARHLDAHQAVLGQHGLGTGAVAAVGGVFGLGCTGQVAQVVRQLGVQRALDERLLERQRGSVDRLRAHRTSDELVNELLGDQRQCRHSSLSRLRRLPARHRNSPVGMLCLTHKKPDRLGRVYALSTRAGLPAMQTPLPTLRMTLLPRPISVPSPISTPFMMLVPLPT